MKFQDGVASEDWRCEVCSGTGDEPIDGRTVAPCSQCEATGIWDESLEENGNDKD